jgi:N-acetylneuraminic acid mutarotase
VKKTISLVLVLALGLSSMVLAEEDTWIYKADMPTARSCLSTSVVNGKIYAIGGIKNANSAPLSTVEEYDPKTNTWTTKSNMPTARISHSASVVEGKIYIIGGGRGVYGSGLSIVEEYDPVSDTWKSKSNMPTARFVLSGSVVNGKIYAIGGKPAHGVSPLKTVEEYDPVTDTWTTRANMRTARYGHCTCVVNGRVYAIGGDPGTYVGLRTVEEYDPTTDTWTRKADMLTPRAFLSVNALGGRIYAIGGVSALYSAALSIVDEYDPATDTWTRKSDMPTPRLLMSSSVANSRIYVMGGAVKPLPSWQACSTVEQYDAGFTFPTLDFNGDGIVDIEDLIILIEHWQQDDPMCDIAPPPLGDGIVDALDLELLMSYWGQPIDDPTLIAHWNLDEAEGVVAYDSVGNNDAVTFGGPLWQPGGGMADGAIQLDGVDDCVIIGSIPNPTKGPFSVFAWVNGGAPGQVVLSQMGGANWLCTSPSDGSLMTGLKSTGVDGRSLGSEAVITDNDWHRIGLTWDGSTRILYVDDIAVAQDTQLGLEGSDSGLYLGCGKAMEPGTFFSGLIDDVRIYNRAINP